MKFDFSGSKSKNRVKYERYMDQPFLGRITATELSKMDATIRYRLRMFRGVNPKHIQYYGTIFDDVMVKYLDEEYGPDAYTIYAIVLPCYPVQRICHISEVAKSRGNVKIINLMNEVCSGGTGHGSDINAFVCMDDRLGELQALPGLCIARCEQQRFFDIRPSEYADGFESYIDNGFFITKYKENKDCRILLFPADGFAIKTWRLMGHDIQAMDYNHCVEYCKPECKNTLDPKFRKRLGY